MQRIGTTIAVTTSLAAANPIGRSARAPAITRKGRARDMSSASVELVDVERRPAVPLELDLDAPLLEELAVDLEGLLRAVDLAPVDSTNHVIGEDSEMCIHGLGSDVGEAHSLAGAVLARGYGRPLVR